MGVSVRTHIDESEASNLISYMTYLRSVGQLQILYEASFVWGDASTDFVPDRIITLVSMATDNRHGDIIG